MGNLPLISVIVPVYRVEKYLDRCIRSITEQTYTNLEILLVDDGSPDRSGEICDRWAEKDRRIRVFHKENAGAGAARNTAMDAAAGELMAFVDSDDYLAPDFYEYLYGLLETGADIAECDYIQTAEDDTRFHEGYGSVKYYTAEEAMVCHIWETAFCQVIWNKLYRRQLIGDIRFPTGQKIDDEFFTYQVLGNARKLVRSDKVGYAYRQQPDSVMHQKFSIKQVQSLEAKKQRLRYLEKRMPDLADQAKTELVLACIYAAQGSRRWLSPKERAEAEMILKAAMADACPIEKMPEISVKRKALIRLAQWNLKITAGILNLLEDIHLLS